MRVPNRLLVNVLVILGASRGLVLHSLGLFILLVDEFLLLLEDFKTLLVGSGTFGVAHLEIHFVVEFLGNGGEDGFQGVDLRGHFCFLALGVDEGVGEDEEGGWDAVLETEIKPAGKVVP